VITGFLFDHLPAAPFEVVNAHLSWDWSTMTEDNFAAILMAFGDYFAKRGTEPDTWGMFAALGLTHASSGRFNVSLQFCNPDGRCDDLKPMEEFLDCFQGFSQWRDGPLCLATDALHRALQLLVRIQGDMTSIGYCGWMRRLAIVAAAIVGVPHTSPPT
jgi:hypothetical protein